MQFSFWSGSILFLSRWPVLLKPSIYYYLISFVNWWESGIKNPTQREKSWKLSIDRSLSPPIHTPKQWWRTNKPKLLISHSSSSHITHHASFLPDFDFLVVRIKETYLRKECTSKNILKSVSSTKTSIRIQNYFISL